MKNIGCFKAGFMKCWAVQQCLPLYAGENDLPLFRAIVAKHLTNCAACNQTYQQYLASRRLLHRLKHATIPQPKFEETWQKLHACILQQQSHPPNFAQYGWLPAGAFSLLLVTGAWLFFQEFTQQFFTPPLPQKSTPNISKNNDSPAIHPTIKPAAPIFNFLGNPRDERIILSLPLYELDEARPLQKLDGSF